jgi:RNA polymerase sigma factor (sigma-70 family)
VGAVHPVRSMSDELLVGKVLDIPKAMAKKYGRGEQEREELESIGYLELVKAARTYDPSRCEVSDFGAFAAQRVQWAVWGALGSGGGYGRHEKRWQSLLSLDGPDEEEAGLRATIASTTPDPGDTVASAEILKMLVSRLKPLHRAAYLLVKRDNLSPKEAAERLGLNRQTVYRFVTEAEGRLARCAKAMGKKRGAGPGVNPPRSKKQRRAASKFIKDQTVMRHALGDIPHKYVWYLADDDARTLKGPGRLTGLLNGLGIPGDARSPQCKAKMLSDPRLGKLRPVPGLEGRRLAQEEGYVLVKSQAEIPAQDH